MAFWFGVRPWELDDLTWGEVEELCGRLRDLPPIGGVVLMEPRR